MTPKPVNAHAYSPSPDSSRAAIGIAVATAIASKATSETSDTTPVVVRQRWVDHSPSGSGRRVACHGRW